MTADDRTPGDGAEGILNEAERLIWAMLDEQVDEADTTKLSAMLEEHDEVRRRYLDCVQLHVDLQDHFAASNARGDATRRTPILSHLMPGGVPGAEGAPITD
jgi:hypothetical protein